MGGCASKPKEFNSTPATLPGENSVNEPAIKDVEVETTQEPKKAEETKTEEPLVDLSEPTKEPKVEAEVSADSKNAISDLVSEISVPSEVKQTEEKVVAGDETTEKTKEEPVVTEATPIETAKSDVAVDEKPKTTEEKEEPIVTL